MATFAEAVTNAKATETEGEFGVTQMNPIKIFNYILDLRKHFTPFDLLPPLPGVGTGTIKITLQTDIKDVAAHLISLPREIPKRKKTR